MKTESHIDFKNGILDISSLNDLSISVEDVMDAFIKLNSHNVNWGRLGPIGVNDSTFRNIKSNSFDSTNIDESLNTSVMGAFWSPHIYISWTTDIWMSNEEPGHE